MTDHDTHGTRGFADADAAPARLILAHLNHDGDAWIATWNELADCPQCMCNVAQTITAKAAEALTCIPDDEHDDCALCDRETDPDADTADDVAKHLAGLLDFIAKGRQA